MTDQQVTVRPEQAADHTAVFELTQAAFGQADEAELVEALRKSASPLVSLVAEVEGEIVGHILFSPVTVRPAATDESPEPPAGGHGFGDRSRSRSGVDLNSDVNFQAPKVSCESRYGSGLRSSMNVSL